jgi:hypothetical protein
MKVIHATASTFWAEDDADRRFYVVGTLGSGLLRFQVIARLPDGTKGTVTGREFFDALMQHFGVKVRIIEGSWIRASGLTTNLDLFNQATAAGLTPEQAAVVATKTGRWADAYGFSNVHMVDLVPRHAVGHYDKVIAQFSK